MRTGAPLDHRGDPVRLDASHDALEAIARGLRDRGPPARRLPLRAGDAKHVRERDEPLTAARAPRAQLARRAPPPEGVRGDAEHLRRLPDADRLVLGLHASRSHRYLGIMPPMARNA